MQGRRRHVLRECDTKAPVVWGDHAARCMVASALVRISGTVDLPCVLHVGGVPGNSLLAWPKRGELSFAIVLAGDFRWLSSCDFRSEAELVAALAGVLAGAFDPLGSRGFSADLLLLPRGLLQGVLGRPSRLRCR